jgi:hypothetical protein
MSIPKIIHQLWIGPKPCPIKLMNTWKDKNPDFEYILWNEQEFIKRNMTFRCQTKIDEIEEINGKADILRWEILYHYGGVFIDADSICIEPIDDELMNKSSFAGWEQEEIRTGLIATGTMGFPPNSPLVGDAINWILKNEVSQKKTGMQAWKTVGPGLLTRMHNYGNFKDLHIFPSYTFLPIHLTGLEYKGHGKIYAFQAWGSTMKSYDILNNIELPSQFLKPPNEIAVSILVSSYNTKWNYIQECLESIKLQMGLFNIELVWINDGSDALNTATLKGLLDSFARTTRFTKVIYYENEKNMGVSFSLNLGVNLCSNELIIRMDSDDIMVNDRIIKQITFMKQNPQVHICGGQIVMFKDNVKNIVSNTNHKSLTINDFKKSPIHWIANHPTLCYRKSSILAVGNYDINYNKIEDYELLLRFLKKYGYIHNMHDILLLYRLHDNQVTHNGGTEGREYWHKIRLDLINKLINS